MGNRLVKKLWQKMLPWAIGISVLLAMSITMNIVSMTYMIHKSL